MILDGVSYSAFIHFCRVILYHIMNPTVVSLSRVEQVLSDLPTTFFCLWASIDALVFPF